MDATSLKPLVSAARGAPLGFVRGTVTGVIPVGFLCLAMMQAFWGSNAAAAQPVLRAADQKGFEQALFKASHALDGAPYQIEWSEFSAASPLLQALSAGAVDTGVAGDGPFLFAYGAGQNVRATLAFAPRGGGHLVGILVGPHSVVGKAGDLAGKTVAVVRGSIGHELLLQLSAAGRLKLDRVKLVFLSPAQSKVALEAGSVDAWATWEPYLTLETAIAGGRIIEDGAGIMTSYAFQVAYTGAIAGKHALLEDFNQRVAAAMRWGIAHPAEYAAIWSRQTDVPLNISRKITDGMRTNAIALNDAVIKTERGTLEIYRHAAALPADGPPLDAAFDRSFGSRAGRS